MKDANHALDLLSRKIDLPNLSFPPDDQVGLALTPDLTIYLTRLDDETIEVSCQIDGLDYPDAAMMQALLEANFLGGATGLARLALDADTAEVILCEGWNVTDFDATALERRFDAFVSAAAFWKGEGTVLLLDQARALRAEKAADSVENPDDDSVEAPVLMRL